MRLLDDEGRLFGVVKFKGEPVREGDDVTLDLGTTTITPTVDRIE